MRWKLGVRRLSGPRDWDAPGSHGGSSRSTATARGARPRRGRESRLAPRARCWSFLYLNMMCNVLIEVQQDIHRCTNRWLLVAQYALYSLLASLESEHHAQPRP